MMDKVIAWAIVGVLFFIRSFVGDFVEPYGGEETGMKTLYIFAIMGIMMVNADCDGDNVFNRIIECIKGCFMNAVWFTLAIVVYVLIGDVVGGSFDVMNLVNTAIFVAVKGVLAVMVWAGFKAAMKA